MKALVRILNLQQESLAQYPPCPFHTFPQINEIKQHKPDSRRQTVLLLSASEIRKKVLLHLLRQQLDDPNTSNRGQEFLHKDSTSSSSGIVMFRNIPVNVHPRIIFGYHAQSWNSSPTKCTFPENGSCSLSASRFEERSAPLKTYSQLRPYPLLAAASSTAQFYQLLGKLTLV
jgi:hypothetical protein